MTSIITFTNLFPSASMPRHGLFVWERMRRVVAALGCAWRVVCPVPRAPRFWPKRALDRVFAGFPAHETFAGVEVFHPQYRHLPGLSLRAQAERMADSARDLVADLARDRPVVLDAHYVYPDGVAALTLARELQVPCFVTARGSDINLLGPRPEVEHQVRALAGGATRLFAVSEELRGRFAAVAGLADDRVELVRNGVDLDRFHPGDPAAARRALGLPLDAALVVGVGRLVEVKGFHLMAKALRSLPSSVHFAVAGAGPERARLEGLAPPGRLHLLGSRSPDEIAELLRAADLLVCPSEREGWPNVVTEALASGVPVVASAVGAVPDMLSVPYAGALVRVGDHRALGREVERFLSAGHDPERIRAFAQRFSWDEPVRLLCDAFRSAWGTR